MGYANAMFTEDLENKITKHVHNESTRLMCADETYQNHTHIPDVLTLETEQALSNENIPIVENPTKEANQALTTQSIKQMIAEALQDEPYKKHA